MKQVSLKKNFIMNVILTLSSFLFPLITFPYVSRILLPVGNGKVNFATAIISYFTMFAQLGIPTYGIRVCAEVREDREALSRTAQELLIINLAVSLLAYLLLALGLVFVPRLREERTLFLLVSATIFLSAIGMEWLYRALEQYTYIAIRSIIFKLLALVMMFALVHSQSDYVLYGGISVFAASASNLLNFVNAHRFISWKPLGGYRFRRHLRAVGIFFAMSVATTVYTNLDTIMLGFMTTDTDVGYYNAAVRIKVILTGIVTSLGTVILPRASYYVEKGNMEEFRRITGKALNFVTLTAAPLTLYFILFASQGIYLLSGLAYEGSILPMKLIMPTVFLIGLSNILGIQVLVPTGREKLVLYSVLAGAVTDLLLNAALIPHFRASGAAIGTLAAELVVLLVQYLVLRDEIRDQVREISLSWIGLGLLLASAASLWTVRLRLISNLTWNSFLILALSALIFFGIYAGILVLAGEKLTIEIRDMLANKLFRRKGGRRT